VNWTLSNPERMFSNYPDIQYIEIHNDPNLILEGLKDSWRNGVEFANWFQEVVNAYRQFWPDKKYGFPGLSPGNTIASVRQDSGSFLSEASLAAVSTDWIGVHVYWQTEAQMHSLEGASHGSATGDSSLTNCFSSLSLEIQFNSRRLWRISMRAIMAYYGEFLDLAVHSVIYRQRPIEVNLSDGVGPTKLDAMWA